MQFGKDFCDFDASIHAGEMNWLNNYPWASERILACGNRWGKTLTASVKLRHHLLYQARRAKYAHITHDYRCLALSMTVSMARLAFDEAFYGGLNHPLYHQFIVEGECRAGLGNPQPMMVIGQGGHGRDSWRSELWARSTVKGARFLLGTRFDFMDYDEASRDVQGKKLREEVLLMRLADREGRIDYTSTGNGKNWYWELFMEGRKDETHGRYYSQTGQVYENPTLPKEFIEELASKMSAGMREQNIYGGFADVGVFFSHEALQNCYTDVDYLFPQEPKKKHRYVMAGDFARKMDKTVILVADIDTTPAQLVFGEEMERVDWPDQFERTADIYRTYNNAPLLADETAMGGDMVVQFLGLQYGVNVTGLQVGGTQKSKEALLIAGQRALMERKIIWPYVPQLRELYDQLAFYTIEDKNIATDWVMAFCLLAEQLQRTLYREPDIIQIFEPLVGSIRRDWETGRVYIPGLSEKEMPKEMDSMTYARRKETPSV